MNRSRIECSPGPIRPSVRAIHSTHLKQNGRPLRLLLMCSLSVLFLSACGGRGPNVEEIRATASNLPSAPEIQFDEHDWPLWKGIDQNGVRRDSPVVTSWSEADNVVWRVDVPGQGHSSPVLIQDTVILTTADESIQTQSILAFDRHTGKPLWSFEANRGAFVEKHSKNTHASATPATDGRLIFAPFANHDRVQVVAVDLAGNLVWDVDIGEFQSQFGYGASPTLFQDYVIVSGDGMGGGFLAALHRDTGVIAWRVLREGDGRRGSYSSPVVAELGGRAQLIHTGYNQTISYDPATGDELWRAQGPSSTTANSMAHADPYVLVTGGYPQQNITCLNAANGGEVVWSVSRGKAYVPSPLINGPHGLVLTDNGVLMCFELATGKRLWQKRLGGNYSASLVQAGTEIFALDEEGLMRVFRNEGKFVHVADNQLASSGGMATPSLGNGRLYIRTSSALYCLGTESPVE